MSFSTSGFRKAARVCNNYGNLWKKGHSFARVLISKRDIFMAQYVADIPTNASLQQFAAS